MEGDDLCKCVSDDIILFGRHGTCDRCEKVVQQCSADCVGCDMGPDVRGRYVEDMYWVDGETWTLSYCIHCGFAVIQ